VPIVCVQRLVFEVLAEMYLEHCEHVEQRLRQALDDLEGAIVHRRHLDAREPAE
jgi:hypothetical protein